MSLTLNPNCKRKDLKLRRLRNCVNSQLNLPTAFHDSDKTFGKRPRYLQTKNLIYLTVEVVPFRRRPGASQCFNCNYFNHTSKNCKMTPRCLKCEEATKLTIAPKQKDYKH
ncbi:hypothetical protein TNCV_3704031 [Trichonephila clavipes]|nr:hypothetical protein TNCV_3704031 [Trichonephila clavipes]